jgi:SPP1 gp7 family putative phage head morphogenesis protein
MKAELRRWERKALKAVKARGRAAVGFESDVIDADVAAEISTGLKSVSSAEGVRSVFAPFTKTVDVSEMTPAERRIYRNVQKVLRASRDPMAAAILAEEPVDITQMSAELRAALEPVLVEAYVERFTALAQTAPPAIDIPAAGTFAADWAKLYTFDLVRGISTTTAKILQDAVATFMATPGMTRRELEALIEPAFGRRRASLIAVTEATRAAQAATVQTQTILRNAGYQTTRIWRALNDELVCKVCGPQDGKEEARWTAPEPPAHPGCRCSTTLEFIG